MSSFDENLNCEDDVRGYDEYLARSGAFEDIPDYATEEEVEAALAAQYDALDAADHDDFLWSDEEADADTLASAGYGTDEDYGGFDEMDW